VGAASPPSFSLLQLLQMRPARYEEQEFPFTVEDSLEIVTPFVSKT
jgi:hypothetical protein